MNYEKHYNLLIEKADNRCILPGVYKEKHHIIPRCMGGNDDSENLVELFPEEHFVLHQLLTKIYPNNNKLICACGFLSSHKTKNRNNKTYSWLKIRRAENMSEMMKERWKDTEYRNNMSEMMKERWRDTEHRNNISQKIKDRIVTPETRKRMSLSQKGEKNPMFGKKHNEKRKKEIGRVFSKALKGIPKTEEHKKNLSEAKKGISHHTDEWKREHSKRMSGDNNPMKRTQKIVKCPYCEKTGKYNGMKRWHFDNCKHKQVT